MERNSEKFYPPYRHQELYAWNEDYQRHKFFTEEDYAAERRIWKQKRRGNMDDPDYSPPSWEAPQFRYEDRYGSLKQDTAFFKNFCRLDEMRKKCRSWPEFALKCVAEGVEEDKARFYLLYLWFSKARWFGYPENYWSYLEDRRTLSKAEIEARYTTMARLDMENCCSYDDIRRQAFASGHKACGYARFVEREL